MTNTDKQRRFPLISLLLSSGVVASVMTAIAYVRPNLLTDYFGDVHPLAVGISTCIAGIFALYFLHSRWSLAVTTPVGFSDGALFAVLASIPFMIAVTVADIILRFPNDVSVKYPIAFIFYPIIGYVAQIILHIVPLAVALIAFDQIFKSWSMSRKIWLAIALVPLPEAIFQAHASWTSDPQIMLAVFVTLHLYLFGVVELYIYRRYDFLSMYVFRISYYGYWHIGWGYIRLEMLF